MIVRLLTACGCTREIEVAMEALAIHVPLRLPAHEPIRMRVFQRMFQDGGEPTVGVPVFREAYDENLVDAPEEPP